MSNRLFRPAALLPGLLAAALSPLAARPALAQMVSPVVSGAASGPICTKCTAGPQSTTPMRTLLIRVVANNHPVKNAKVTLTNAEDNRVIGTFTTSSSGKVHTSAMLGSYQVSVQTPTLAGSLSFPVRSGAGGVTVTVPLAAPTAQ